MTNFPRNLQLKLTLQIKKLNDEFAIEAIYRLECTQQGQGNPAHARTPANNRAHTQAQPAQHRLIAAL